MGATTRLPEPKISAARCRSWSVQSSIWHLASVYPVLLAQHLRVQPQRIK
jgi:hypothetical protein